MSLIRKSLVGLGAALVVAGSVFTADVARAESTTYPAEASVATPDLKDQEQAFHKFLTERGIEHRMEVVDGVETVVFDVISEEVIKATEEFYNSQMPDREEVAKQAKADAEEMKKYLASRGFDVEVVVNEFNTVEVPAADENDKILDAVDDFWWQKYPMSEAEIEAANAEEQRLADHLTARGFTITVETDRHGLKMVNGDWDDPKLEEAINEFFASEAQPYEE